MSNTLSLLTLPHTEALQQMVQDKLVVGVSVADLVIDTPVVLEGLEMQTTVYISAGAYSNPNWPYFGNVDFVYTRLDMGDAFAGIPLAFRMPAVCTSQDLANKLGQALVIYFSAEDIFQESLAITQSPQTVVLKAGPNSRRWRGQVSITVYPEATSGDL